jgi:hypothetical protein
VPVEFYLILHVFCVALLGSGLGLTLLQDPPSKFGQILLGASSLLIFVAGFGLMAKLHLPLSTPWVMGKILAWWVIATGAPIIAKRKPHLKKTFFWVSIVLILVSISLAFLKPM